MAKLAGESAVGALVAKIKSLLESISTATSNAATALSTANSAQSAATAASTAAAQAQKDATWYGSCSTAAATAAKVVSVGDGFELKVGVKIAVLFTQQNTADSATLNVNGTGAKAIGYRGSTNKHAYAWNAYEACLFYYDGTYWRLAKGRTSRVFTVTVPTGSWSSSAPHSKTINVAGIYSSDYPIVDVQLSADVAAAKLQLTAWACVSRIVTNNGSITIYCNESVPTTAITLLMQVPVTD